MTTSLWKLSELPQLLAADFALPPQARWRREFAPELSYGRHSGPARQNARIAAVAIVLCWDGAQWSLPLTVRDAALTHHGGQISLPGGLIDAGESPREAAAREFEEELGVTAELEWLGELSPLFVYASNTVVTPCVAAIDHRPAWRPNPAEVASVLTLAASHLLEMKPTPPLAIERGPLRFWAPQLIVEGHSAWGATAVMLGELRGRLKRVAEVVRGQ